MSDQKVQSEKKLPIIAINRDWCKACGICVAFCPKQVLSTREDGQPEVTQRDECIECMLCEYRCPDFAITVRSDDDESE